MLAETETDREVEHDVDIGPRLAARRDDGRAKLHQFAGILVEAEADAQPLALPGAGDRQHDVGISGGGRQIEIGLDVKLQLAQRLGAARRIGMRQQQVGAEPDQRANTVGLCLDRCAIEIVRKNPAGLARPERPLGKPERLRHCVASRNSLPETSLTGTCAN